jgi:ERCC4-type nuclease
MISNLPEEKGADILIYSKAGLYGAQRKEVPHDFISSVADGRLARSMALITKECKFSELICEGRFRYYPDGHLAVNKKVPSRYTRKQIRGILFNLKWIVGINHVEYTEDIDDTANYLRWLYDSLNKTTHRSMFSRPSAKGTWVVPTNTEIQSWILQSWPGIGPVTADAIIDKFKGIPLKWTCTLDELSKVPKLGRPKALELMKALNADIKVDNTEKPKMTFDEIRKRLRH